MTTGCWRIRGYQQPESVRYEGMTTAVRTLVVLRPVDPSLACVTLDAGSQKLLYHRVYTLAADDNTGICSAIAYGQNTLAAGEQFSFYISNFTTCTPSITVTPVVYAIRSSDNLRIDLWRGEAMRMAYGESTESAPCRVASWSAELLPGQYAIYGEAVYEYGSKTVKLSTLQVNADQAVRFHWNDVPRQQSLRSRSGMCCRRRKRRIWHRVPQSGTGTDGTRFIFCEF